MVLKGESVSAPCVQGRIEPPEAARGHATSYSARIDGIVLKITFPVEHGMVTDVRQNLLPGDIWQQGR